MVWAPSVPARKMLANNAKGLNILFIAYMLCKSGTSGTAYSCCAACVFLYCCAYFCFLLSLLHHDGVNHGNSGDIDDVAYRAFEVGKVDRFVKSHLDRANYFAIVFKRLYHFV